MGAPGAIGAGRRAARGRRRRDGRGHRGDGSDEAQGHGERIKRGAAKRGSQNAEKSGENPWKTQIDTGCSKQPSMSKKIGIAYEVARTGLERLRG